jgi:hypothetical protein
MKSVYGEGKLGVVSFAQVEELNDCEVAEVDRRLDRILELKMVEVSGVFGDMVLEDGSPCVLGIQLSFGEGLLQSVKSLLEDCFGGVERCVAHAGNMAAFWREGQGPPKVWIEELDAAGEPIFYSSDYGGLDHRVIFVLEGTEYYSDRYFISYTVEQSCEVFAPHRLIDTYVGLARLRGKLSMNLGRDIYRMSWDEEDLRLKVLGAADTMEGEVCGPKCLEELTELVW